MEGFFQIPPDLVVKSQAIDSTEVILSLIRRPKVVQTLHRNRKSRLELLFISETHRSTTKSSMQAWPAPPRMQTAWNGISVGIRWNV